VSVRQITRAMDYGAEHELSPSRRLVLFYLADGADDAGRFWPSQKRIAKFTGLGVSTIRRHLRELERDGVVRIEARSRGEGRGRTSNVYILQLDGPPPPDELPPAAGGKSSGPTAHSDTTNRPIEHDQPPAAGGDRTVREPSGPASVEKEQVGNKEWEEWLDHYRQTTGRNAVGSSSARAQFQARRREGVPLERLKLATVGCHADRWRRERGHDVPDTILRASNWEKYALAAEAIQLRQRKGGKLAPLVRSAA